MAGREEVVGDEWPDENPGKGRDGWPDKPMKVSGWCGGVKWV